MTYQSGDIKVQALQNIDLSINPGEFTAIVGPSGSGKTTLLNIIGGLDSPTKGSVKINDTDITQLPENELIDFRLHHIGFIFQFHQLLPEFTALENVCIPAFIGNKSKQETTKKAKEILEFLGLSHRLHHKPNELSGGEQQRIAVARSLINQPKVIFADEPSGNLDSNNSKELHQLFFDLRDEFNQTFVIITHNNELSEMTDRKLIMQDGNLIG